VWSLVHSGLHAGHFPPSSPGVRRAWAQAFSGSSFHPLVCSKQTSREFGDKGLIWIGSLISSKTYPFCGCGHCSPQELHRSYSELMGIRYYIFYYTILSNLMFCWVVSSEVWPSCVYSSIHLVTISSVYIHLSTFYQLSYLFYHLLSISLSIHPSIHPPTHLSIYVPMYLSIYHLPTYLSFVAGV
jgi:hypothetical protein